MNITYSECVSVALVIQHERACAVLYCHLWPFRPCHVSPHYHTNCTIYVRKQLDIKCVWVILSATLSETSLVLRRAEWDMINVHTSSCKYPLFLSDLNETFIFSTYFRNNAQISEVCPVAAEFQADGQTDMAKLIVAFRCFANAPSFSDSYKICTWCAVTTSSQVVLFLMCPFIRICRSDFL